MGANLEPRQPKGRTGTQERAWRHQIRIGATAHRVQIVTAVQFPNRAGLKFSPDWAFFGVLKNLAGFGIDADFLNNFSLLDVEGITQAAATLFGFKFFILWLGLLFLKNALHGSGPGR